MFINREVQKKSIGSATISKKHSEFVYVRVCVIKNDRVVERNSRTTRDTLSIYIYLVMDEDGISIQFDKSENPQQQKSILG